MISLVVRVSVPYAAIAEQLSAFVERDPYPITAGLVRGRVHVSDVLVRPSGARLTVDVSFRAELAWPVPVVRGVLHVSGTPVYDASTQRLRLSDVSITGDVDHVLARAALAFKRRAIEGALTAFSLDLEPVLRDLRDRLNASLSGRGLAPNVPIQGQVETMRVDEILVAEELIVVASASGHVRALADLRVGD